MAPEASACPVRKEIHTRQMPGRRCEHQRDTTEHTLAQLESATHARPAVLAVPLEKNRTRISQNQRSSSS